MIVMAATIAALSALAPADAAIKISDTPDRIAACCVAVFRAMGALTHFPKIKAVNDSSAGNVPTVFEGIVRQRCLAATYNRTEVTLAPHVIYTRHGDLFIDGVVIERDGRPPKELKLGTFKLAGLTGLRLTPRAFKANPLFSPGDPKYGDSVLMTVELD